MNIRSRTISIKHRTLYILLGIGAVVISVGIVLFSTY